LIDGNVITVESISFYKESDDRVAAESPFTFDKWEHIQSGFRYEWRLAL